MSGERDDVGAAAYERIERAVDAWRQPVGFALAAAALVAILLAPGGSLKPEAQRLAAVMAAVVVLWVTEALPLPVTALAGCAACALLKVAPAKTIFAPFADPLMFLFIGSFILARAIFLHGLDRRMAYTVLALPWVGGRPERIMFAFGAVTAALSGWISNTATTAMMFPIGLALLRYLSDSAERDGGRMNPKFGTALMLMTSFAASIGGLATPIGTPTNLIGLGHLRSLTGLEVSFFQWSLLGAPVVVTLFLFTFGYFRLLCPAGVTNIAGGHELLVAERDRLGPWTTAQRSTVAAFLVTAALWILPGLIALALGTEHGLYKGLNERMPEGVVAVLGAALLFLLPGNGGRRAIDWSEAEKIDWGVVLLYGGGFALGQLSNETGLATFLGDWLAEFVPQGQMLPILIGGTIVAAVVSELTSNTASANIVVPLVIAVSQAAGVNPAYPALAATFSSSLGFMLPVSTPCNAIVYSTGYIPLGRMIRYGAILDVAGAITMVALTLALGPLIFGR